MSTESDKLAELQRTIDDQTRTIDVLRLVIIQLRQRLSAHQRKPITPDSIKSASELPIELQAQNRRELEQIDSAGIRYCRNDWKYPKEESDRGSVIR